MTCHRMLCATLQLPCVPLIPSLAMFACLMLAVANSTFVGWIGCLILLAIGNFVHFYLGELCRFVHGSGDSLGRPSFQNEYQPYSRVIIEMSAGEYLARQAISRLKVKYAAWPTSWWSACQRTFIQVTRENSWNAFAVDKKHYNHCPGSLYFPGSWIWGCQ